MWTSKGLVCTHKMVINIVSEVGCKPLQDMLTVLRFAFDNLQNRAYLLITNSVILHLARESSLTFSYGLSFPARFQIQEPYFPFRGFSGMLLICLKPSSQLLLLLFVFLMRIVNIAHFIHI